MSFPRYPKYKESGVEWLGAVPESWPLLPAKRSFLRKKDLNYGMKCENRLSLTLGGVVPRDLNDLDGLQASEFETYQIFQADDLVFKLIDLQNIRTSRVGLVPEIGIMSPAYIRLEPNKGRVNSKFAYWYFTDLYNRCIFNELGGGVRQTLTSEELLLLPFPSPSLPEQTRIATFLDRETAKIDGLVAEQQRLIDLLKEKRQAVISHAVTKGLNPAAPMRPSGIEWLGDVPAHWGKTKLKHSLDKMIDNRGRSPVYANEGVPILEARHLSGTSNTNTYDFDKFIDAKDVNSYVRDNVRENDVLFITVGTVGKVNIIDKNPEFAILQNIVGLRFKPDVNPLFMLYLLKSNEIRYAMSANNKDSILDSIKISDFIQTAIAIPPYLEQTHISQQITSVINKYDGLIERQNEAISLLQERRTALISAAVTGQIDVRHLAETAAA